MFYFSSFIFQKTDGFIKEDNSSGKVATVEEELDGVDVDDIRNFEGLPRLVFIEEEGGNFQVVNDGRDPTRNINQKKKSDVLQDVHSVINVAGKSVSSITMWTIVNQLGKHDGVSVVSNLKIRELFSDKMNKNRFDPIL